MYNVSVTIDSYRTVCEYPLEGLFNLVERGWLLQEQIRQLRVKL